MKRLETLLGALLLFTAIQAADFEVDGISYNILSNVDMTCEVTSRPNLHPDSVNVLYTDSVTIPPLVTYSGNTFVVTGIGDKAFLMCTGLTSVAIPNTITRIGYQSFCGCSDLSSMIIPSSVKSIGNEAFSSCPGLKSVLIPNSVTSIGESAFLMCSGLTSIMIPDSVTTLQNAVFSNCSGLMSVMIPGRVTSIGDYAFCACSSLTLVAIPNSVKSIGSEAFYGCSGLSLLAIPRSVTSIGDAVFYECTNLGSMVIPDSVTNIGRYTFYGCANLTTLFMPDTLEYIEEGAFSGCTKLNSIQCLAVNPPMVESNVFYGVSRADCIIKVPSGSVDDYNAANVWKEFMNIDTIGNVITPPEPIQCAAPTITVEMGKVSATSITPGAKCFTSISSPDIRSYSDSQQINLTGEYVISSYAYADGFLPSGIVTKTINIAQQVVERPVHDTTLVVRIDTIASGIIINDTIITVVPVEVLDTIYVYDNAPTSISLTTGQEITLKVKDGEIILIGVPYGAVIQVYTIAGIPALYYTATSDEIALSLKRDEIYIFNISGKIFKVKI